jgi:dextranase
MLDRPSLMIRAASTDKSYYRPGEEVSLKITLCAESERSVQVVALIRHLAADVASLAEALTLQPGIEHSLALRWSPPPHAPRGYGVDIRVEDASGALLAHASTAFDVLHDWTEFPRYGFLTDFTASRTDMAQTIESLSQYHINGIQFYDWMHRHATLLPPTDEFIDPLGRPLSMATIRAFIDAAHSRNIAAMPYVAIYGAAPDFAHNFPGWMLYDESGAEIPFAGEFLYIMNPAPDSPWADHLLREAKAVLRQTQFDGLHIDQYGEPHEGFDSTGSTVDMPAAFAAFIAQAKQHALSVDPRRAAVVFNCVANWPIEAIAPAAVDFVYVELWPPDITYAALHRTIREGQARSGGKPVVLAAYTNPAHEVHVRLMKAVIFASGGTQIELGERGAMLADPYFPKYGIVSGALEHHLRRAYDFAVRYGNVLALGSESTITVSLDDTVLSADLAPNSVSAISRRGSGFEAINLINLTGVSQVDWTQPDGPAPTPLRDLHVRIDTHQPVRALTFASPDAESPHMQPLDFTTRGQSIEFTLPTLEVWALILVEWESEESL